jgi:hypothetical protein
MLQSSKMAAPSISILMRNTMPKRSFPGEYKKFRELLLLCIGGRSQRAFAQETGLSTFHLNKLINSPVIARPNRSTLFTLAEHSEGRVSYPELSEACGYSDPLSSSCEEPIKNCPCCGGDAGLLTGNSGVFVRCSACGLRTDVFPDAMTACRKWNSRV